MMRGPLGEIHKKGEAFFEVEQDPGLHAYVLTESLPKDCEILDKSINLYELNKHMAH